MKKSVLTTCLALFLLFTACTPNTPPTESEIVTSAMQTAIAGTSAARLNAIETPAPEPSMTATSVSMPEQGSGATLEPTLAPPDAALETDLKIAYTDDQANLWFWQSGAGSQQLTDSSDINDFALSPDGSQVFFSRANIFNEYSLWLINTDGSQEHQVMSADDFAALPRPDQAVGVAPSQLGWAPGSHTAVFTTHNTYDGPGMDMNNDLRLVNGTTGAVSTLLEPGQGGGMYFYSPDGSQIALVKPDQIDLINSDGSHRRPAALKYGNVLMYTESPFYAQPVWSADGSRLRVIILAEDRLGKPEEPSSVWEIQAASGTSTHVLDFHLNGFGPAAAISPDLQWLVYFQATDSGGQQDLHIASLDGATDEIYAHGSLNWVTWTTDSRRFVWTRYGEVGSARQTFLGESGQEPIQLGAPQAPTDLAWVDGDRFLFLENDGATPPGWKLYLGSVGTSNQWLADLAAGNGIPRFEFAK
ncbi:hypothetical protein LARV_01636 [Longilinea arvoryzae]|uniref:Periplasmic component of the Tol biopolymer transport system n=1 Tax=Longilinea arvoryzae TaxID=360412 RepID=A0A0S7BJB5_9CHLR|nr:hypothetical protein [Longilinea arvoryzae]GAP13877.1 hypothetical protein LARV_01636 [Longilinea arvoryzae]